MKYYIGITTGPIFDTINLATKPAALWFASSLFSDLTRRICEAVKKKFADAEIEIYSPYYSENIDMSDGIGKFHDRIIFSVNHDNKDEIKAILDVLLKNVKGDTTDIVSDGDNREFFEGYLRTPYVIFAEEEIPVEQRNNINLAISPYLDELELMPTSGASSSKVGPLYEMLTDLGEKKITKSGKEKTLTTNEAVRMSSLYTQVSSSDNQFKKKDGSFWSIEDIASARGTIHDGLKKTDYFAVIAADGDGMGTFLKTLEDNDDNHQLREFSKACLEYDKEAGEIINRHKAMTIYAGGDDLLILSPVVDKQENGSTVLNLCDDIREAFRNHMQRFKEGNHLDKAILPTVSFGISIQYVKFPLYQALQDARTLLAMVKNEKDGRKDATALHIRKHSGQSFGVMLDESVQPAFEQFLQYRAENKGNDNEDRTLTSVLKNLILHESIIRTADNVYNTNDTENQYGSVWQNLFDNPNQERYRKYLDDISMWYWKHIVCDNKVPAEFREASLEGDADKQVDDYPKLEVFLDMFRISKFLIEKEGSR